MIIIIFSVLVFLFFVFLCFQKSEEMVQQLGVLSVWNDYSWFSI